MDALIERGERMSLGDICRILAETAEALDAAHRAGVVHRDIKPDNIFLEGADRRALLMDFGIAKSGGPMAQGLTGTGNVIGTPAYMSPEQASGGAICSRSDIYSLGVIAYRLLTGAPLFGASSPQELLVAHLTRDPTPVRTLAPGVPEPLSHAVMRCLQKQEADRWTSAAEFARILRQHQHQFEAAVLRTGGPDAPWIPTPAEWRRARLAALVAAPVLVAVGGLATPSVPWAPIISAEEARRIAASFFTAQGARSPVEWHVRTLLTPDSIGEDLARRKLGARAGDWASQNAVLGGWTVVHYLPGLPGKWSATIGGTGRVVAFERPSPEGRSPSRPTASP